MKISNWILLFLTIPFCSFGQTKFNVEKKPAGQYSGYVVTSNNDTLVGQIKVPALFSLLHYSVKFINSEGQTTTYLPEDLKLFFFENSQFISCDVNTLTIMPFRYGSIFLQQMTDGYLKYYRCIKPDTKYYGPVPITKMKVYYFLSYGNLRIKYVSYFDQLRAFTDEHPETFNKILHKNYVVPNLYELIYDYDVWLASSPLLDVKKQIDSLHSLTTLNLEQAYNDSLLFYQESDKNMHNYMYRILYYAFNTPGYESYIIWENIDKLGRIRGQGLQVSFSRGFKKIGTWRYFNEDFPDGKVQLIREETYDNKGKRTGPVLIYDNNGNLIKK